MVFGISYGELVVIIGVGAVVLGRRDLIAIASTAGSLTGRAAGLLSAARQRFAVFADSAELATLHKDVQGTMAQLETIREELRRGIVPRTMHSRFADAATMAGPPAQQQEQQQPQQQQEQKHTQPVGSGQHEVTRSTASGAHGLRLPAGAAPTSAAKAVPLPALSSLHFDMGSEGSNPADHLVGDASFDSAAYAAYQALFDVPAGQYAPALQRNGTDAAPMPGDGAASGNLSPDEAVQESMAAACAAFLHTEQGKRLLRQALRDADRGNKQA